MFYGRRHENGHQNMGGVRDGTGQDFLDPTRTVNLKIIAGRPVSDRPGRPVFLQKVFVPCSMYLMKNFQKGGGMGEVLKFVTLDGGIRKKKRKNFCVFCKNNSILRPFLV